MRVNLFIISVFALGLGGCSSSAIISDLETDKAIIQLSGGDFGVADREAAAACGIHSRIPQRLSYRCIDGYCISKQVLYACIAPVGLASPSAPDTVGRGTVRGSYGEGYSVPPQ